MGEQQYRFTDKGTLIIGGHQYFMDWPIKEGWRQEEVLRLLENVFSEGGNDRARSIRRLLNAAPLNNR